MNYLDFILLAIILFFAVSAYKKGFIMACFGFLPMFIALFVSYKIYPNASKFLRSTWVFEKLKNAIESALGLEKLITEKTMETQAELINNMNIPEFLKNSLIENNNPIVYNILDVNQLKDYVSGFLANICINIIALIIVFLLVYLAVKLVLTTLDLVSKLPVLSLFNKVGGLIIGLLQGFMVTWIFFIIMTFFMYNTLFRGFFTGLEESLIAKYIYENNILLFMIMKIFA